MKPKVGFGTAYKLFWKNYVNFTGRSRRSEYWYTILWHIIVSIPGLLLIFGGVLGAIMGLMNSSNTASGVSVVCLIFGWIYLAVYSLAILIPNYALLIRRFHDTGRTMVMPIIIFAWSIIMSFLPNIISVHISNSNSFTGLIIIMILYIVSIVLAIYQIVICCLDSEREHNKYGDSPKYNEGNNQN